MGKSIIFLVVFLVAVYVAVRVVYKQTSIMAGRIKDCCIHLGCTANIMPAVLVAVGVAIMISSGNYVLMAGQYLLIGLAVAGAPILLLFFKHKLNFWKVLVLKIFAIPVVGAQLITNLFGTGHRKSKTVRQGNTNVEYSYKTAQSIVQDNWSLRYLYTFGGDYYENSDGTRCLVDHKRTASFQDLQYDIKPLYNINNPLPRWIAWLY